jgi:hypothetical protein
MFIVSTYTTVIGLAVVLVSTSLIRPLPVPVAGVIPVTAALLHECSRPIVALV